MPMGGKDAPKACLPVTSQGPSSIPAADPVPQHGLEPQSILVKEDLWPFAGVYQSKLVKRCTHRENLACLEAPTSWDTDSFLGETEGPG